MAKKKDKKKNPSKKPPKRSAEDKAYEEDYARGEGLANKFYAPGSLTRLDAGEDIAPISTDMAGGAQSIAQAEDFYNRSQQEDPFIKAALQRGLQSLEGFDSAEGQALKAQALRGIKSDQATSQRAMKQAAGDSGVSGAAAARALRRSRMEDSRQVGSAMTDLAVANIGAKQSALTNFGNMAQNAYQGYQTAQGNALGTLMGARKNVSDYRLAADTANAEIGNTNATRRLQVGQHNAEQDAAERAGQIGTIFGSMGVDEARRNTKAQNRLASKYMKYATRG